MKKSIEKMIFENEEDLLKLVQELDYTEFSIDECVHYDGNELNDILNCNKFDPNETYLAHISGNDSLALITTDYNDDLKLRYRPLIVMNYEESSILVDFTE